MDLLAAALRRICGEAIRLLRGWSVSVSARRLHARIVRATRQVWLISPEPVDPRSLCASIAQIFSQRARAQWTEVEVYPVGTVGGFRVAYVSPDRTDVRESVWSLVVPLVIRTDRVGVVRLRRALAEFSIMDRAELAALATVAALRIRSAFHFAKAVESATNEERLRLAAQLHHGLAQHLANALLRLHLCQRYLVVDTSRSHENLHAAVISAQLAMDAVRGVIYALRYPWKGAPRIAGLLRATAERLRSVTTAEFHLDVDPVESLSSAVEAEIAAIACEALTNAARHAVAKHITVGLHKSNGTLTLEVSDDGKGFDAEKILQRTNNWRELGVALMRDQVRRLGGTFDIQSSPARGTLVTVRVLTGIAAGRSAERDGHIDVDVLRLEGRDGDPGPGR